MIVRIIVEDGDQLIGGAAIDIGDALEQKPDTQGLAQKIAIKDHTIRIDELEEEVRKLKFKKFDKFMEAVSEKKKKPKK